jgi:hypothetical protein
LDNGQTDGDGRYRKRKTDEWMTVMTAMNEFERMIRWMERGRDEDEAKLMA